jgi:hypothetical protein
MGRSSLVSFLAPLVFLATVGSLRSQGIDYQSQYGETREVSLDDILGMPEVYVGHAVRTRGVLEMFPSGGQVVYALRGTFGGRLYLVPVVEAQSEWELRAPKWQGYEVEVTGAVEAGNTGDAVLRLWGFVGPPDKEGKRPPSPGATLEELVTRPGQLDGKVVTVRGEFRGQNLFGDLPSASRRRSSDWVIKDELFAAWVTGRKPKGSGWSLDAGLKRDTGKWLQVTGRVATVKGVVYLEASEVLLSSPPTPTATAEAPPPPPPRPAKPPVVVFSLPLDGERDVPSSTVFKVQFSKDIDEATLKGHVLLRYAGRPQPGDRDLDAVKVDYDRGLRALEVDPGDVLRPGRVVELILLPGIKDIDGLDLVTRPGRNAGAAADVLRFQVAAAGFLTGPSP